MTESLFITVFTWQPHLKTSIEIAIDEKKSGKSVKYCLVWAANLEEGKSLIDYLRRTVRFLWAIYTLAKNKIPTCYFIVRSKKRFSENLSSISELETIRYRNELIGLGIASTLNDLIVENRLSSREALKLVNPSLNHASAVFDLAEQLISRFKPQRLYLFNPRFANTRPLYLAARKDRIPVLTYEIGSSNQRYEILEGSIFDGEVRAKSIIDHWSNGGPEREVVGKSYFTDLRNIASTTKGGLENRLNEFIVAGKINIVFFPSSIHETYALGDLYRHHLFPSQSAAIDSLIKLCASNLNYNLILRIHPIVGTKSREEQDYWLSYSENKLIKVIHFNSSISSYVLSQAADRVFVYHSTIAVELAFEGKSAMALGSPWYIGLDCVYKPRSIKDIIRFIEQGNISGIELKYQNSLLYGYYVKTFGREFKHLKGR